MLNEIGGAELVTKPDDVTPRQPLSEGQSLSDSRTGSALRNPTPDGGHAASDTQVSRALVGNLVIEVRRYRNLRDAKKRLVLQCRAMCRYACDGDLKAGQALYDEAVKEPKSELAFNVLGMMLPYLESMKPLDAAIKVQERTIIKLARQLPIWPWIELNVRGIGPRFLGLIVGEARYPLGEYKSPAALWKRMGLAVFDGQRQRLIAGDAGTEMGYCPRRRSLMWNVGNSLMKNQLCRGEASGPYGALYLERRAYEETRTDKPAAAHGRAKRYMEKRLLRELWKAWRHTAQAIEARRAAATKIDAVHESAVANGDAPE